MMIKFRKADFFFLAFPGLLDRYQHLNKNCVGLTIFSPFAIVVIWYEAEWLSKLFSSETSSEDRLESRSQSLTRSQIKLHNQQLPSLPTQLPAGADMPSCTG